MSIFSDIKKQFEKMEKQAQAEKEKKEQLRRGKELARKQEHEKIIEKIRKEYMSLPPINKGGLIGMRMSKYVQHDNYAYNGMLIELFFVDGTRCFLADRDCSKLTYAKCYKAPDSLDDILEALSCVIPCFGYGGKMEWGLGADKVWGTEEDTWKPIDFSNTGIEHFVNVNEIYYLDRSLYNKLVDVLDSWKEMKVLQLVGRETYDNWIKVLGPCSKVVDEMKKKKREQQDKEKAEKENVKREKEVEKQRQLAEERQKRLDEEARIRKEEFMAELEARHAEEERLEVERQKQIIAAGKRGEEEVNYALKWLDKSYQVLRSSGEKIKIRNTEFIDEVQEYDHIVIGPAGIVLIETKAYSGKINIDKDGNWTRYKNDGWVGTVNPVQQVRRHEKLVHSFIPDDIPIYSYICLANSNVVIEGSENSIVPIVKSDLIVEHIENLEIKNELTKKDIDNCIQLIMKHMV